MERPASNLRRKDAKRDPLDGRIYYEVVNWLYKMVSWLLYLGAHANITGIVQGDENLEPTYTLELYCTAPNKRPEDFTDAVLKIVHSDYRPKDGEWPLRDPDDPAKAHPNNPGKSQWRRLSGNGID
jgi:hypothetical protein